MNLRKFLVLFVIVSMLTMMLGSISFAKTKTSKKTKQAVATVEVWAESGDTKEATSGEAKEEAKPEVKAESGDAIEATSGEAKEVEEAKPEVKAESGEIEEAKPEAKVESGEEVKEAVSGEEVKSSSGEIKEVASGEEVKEETSGEKVIKVNDVKEDDWYKPYVENVLKNNIMKLDEENNFKPNEAATTENVLESISKAENVSYSFKADNKEEFLNKKITREETAYVIYQYAKSAGLGFKGDWMFNLEYADKDKISEEAYEGVAWCTMNKIIIGREDKILDPQAVTTRAELATMVTRLVENI